VGDRRRWEVNIKMVLKELGCVDLDYIHKRLSIS
jgi:hypothetical protein